MMNDYLRNLELRLWMSFVGTQDAVQAVQANQAVQAIQAAMRRFNAALHVTQESTRRLSETAQAVRHATHMLDLHADELIHGNGVGPQREAATEALDFAQKQMLEAESAMASARHKSNVAYQELLMLTEAV